MSARDPAPSRQTKDFAVQPGLCGDCRHARVIVSGRGSTFMLCGRSADDPRYPRYPRLPVLACAGWARGEGDSVEAGG